MKQFYVLIGNFGSGKTEIALNLAFQAVQDGKTTLIDLDIVNPYFRLAEHKSIIEESSIKLIYPLFAMTGVDVPALPPDIYSVFIDDSAEVIFDVGGDPAGATALGQYKRNFEQAVQNGASLETLYVVNPRRPRSSTPELVLEMLEKIRFRSRLEITGFVNNGNLSIETTDDDIVAGYELMRVISDETGIPVRFTAGEERALGRFLTYADKNMLDKKYIGDPFFIKTYMHRDWDRFTRYGI